MGKRRRIARAVLVALAVAVIARGAGAVALAKGTRPDAQALAARATGGTLFDLAVHASAPDQAHAARLNLLFCIRDQRNAYVLRLRPQTVELLKRADGKETGLCPSAQVEWQRENRVLVLRRGRALKVDLNGRLILRATDDEFSGERMGTGVRAFGFTLSRGRAQKLGRVFLADDFQRLHASGAWEPVRGQWEITGNLWAATSVNAFRLFSRFPESPRYRRLFRGRTRRYVGIGLRVEREGDATRVCHVFQNAPAWDAGVKRGDTIVRLNGRPAAGLSLDQLQRLVEGQAGEPLRLAVRRTEHGAAVDKEFRLRRRLMDLDYPEKATPLLPSAPADKSLITAGHDFWTNYTVQAAVMAVRAQASSPASGVGLAAAVQDARNYLLFRWGAEGRIELADVRDGRAHVLGSAPGAMMPDQYYELRLRLGDETVTGFVDGRPVVRATVRRLLPGKVGLYAERGAGVFFDDVRVDSNETFAEKPRRFEVGEPFRKDRIMQEWADRASDWHGLSRPGGTTHWYRFAAPREFAVSLAKMWPGVLKISVRARRYRPRSGYTVEVDTLLGKVRLLRRGREVREAPFDPAAPGALAVSCTRGRASPGALRLGVRLRDEPILEYEDPDALAGNAVAVSGVPESAQDTIRLESAHVLEYAFSRAPVDWAVAAGTWGVMNRWACEPRWSWFGGRSDDLAAIWSKRRFEGDISVDYYVAFEMPSYWKFPHERPGDAGLTICGDGLTPSSGYALIVGGGENRWTRLYRAGRMVAEVRAPRFRFTDNAAGEMEGVQFHETWTRVTLQKSAGHVRFYLNGKLGMDYHDPDPIPGGKVGLWTVRNGMLLARLRIAFDRCGERESPMGLAPAGQDPGWSREPVVKDAVRVERIGNGRAMRVTAARGGGTLAVRRTEAVNLGRTPILCFDYRLPRVEPGMPVARVDLYFDVQGVRHRAIFAGPRDDIADTVTVGRFPGVERDGRWHTAMLSLADLLYQRHDAVRRQDRIAPADLTIQDVALANYSNEGYLLAGFGGNEAGAWYEVRDFRFVPSAPNDGSPPRVEGVAFPFQSAGNSSQVVIRFTDPGGSGLDPRSVRMDLAAPRTGVGHALAIGHPALGYEPASGRIVIDLAAMNVVLNHGERVQVTVRPLRDRAGNAMAAARKFSWRFERRQDRAGPVLEWLSCGRASIAYDFDRGSADWYPVAARRRLMGVPEGGWLRLDTRTFSRDECFVRAGPRPGRARAGSRGRPASLKVQNLRMAHDFGAGFMRDTFNLGRYPVMAFDYRIGPRVPIDVSVEVAGTRYALRFSSTAIRQDLLGEFVSYECLGEAPNVVLDERWHHAEVDLFAMLKAHRPCLRTFSARRIEFSDRTCGQLGSHKDSAFHLDNVRLIPVVSRRDLRFEWNAFDLSGVSDYRSAFNDVADFDPTGRVTNADLDRIRHGRAYFHLKLCDRAGNWSRAYHLPVIVDALPPVLIDARARPGGVPTLRFRFWENRGLDPGSVRLRVGGRAYAVDGKRLWYDQDRGILTWHDEAWRSGPAHPGKTGEPVEVTIVSARDFAGNALIGSRKFHWDRLRATLNPVPEKTGE